MTKRDAESPEEGLGDISGPKLRLLLVAINPAPLSAELRLHFATPQNPFWRLVHESGLTPRRLAPAEAPELLRYGIGLTSLAPRPTRAAAELGRRELRAGAEALAARVERLRPRWVALLGLTLFPLVFPDAREPGPGLKDVTLGRSKVFVLPNPSGRNRAYPGYAPKLLWYRALADALAEV